MLNKTVKTLVFIHNFCLNFDVDNPHIIRADVFILYNNGNCVIMDTARECKCCFDISEVCSCMEEIVGVCIILALPWIARVTMF